MNLAHKLLLAAAAAAALACSMPASAQWAWRDEAGKMVYSDQPPPKSVPAKNIVRQPPAAAAGRARAAGGTASAADDAKAQPSAAAPAAAAPAPTVAAREIEARQRQQQLAEAEKKAAGEEAQRAQVAENCERLRAYQRALEGGHRIGRINAAGEKEIIGDAQRAAEVDRIRAQIEQQCR